MRRQVSACAGWIFPLRYRFRAGIARYGPVRTADLQASAGQFPLITLVLQQQQSIPGIEGDVLHGDGPEGRRERHLVEGMIAAADFSEHLRPDAALITKFVGPTEGLVGRLYDAGFTDEETVRTLAMLSNLCIAHGRDVVYVTGGGAPPRPAMLREGLAAAPPETHPNLARLAAAAIDTYDRAQLDLSIETLIAGTQALRPAING